MFCIVQKVLDEFRVKIYMKINQMPVCRRAIIVIAVKQIIYKRTDVCRASLLRRGLHEVSSEGKVSAQD